MSTEIEERVREGSVSDRKVDMVLVLDNKTGESYTNRLHALERGHEELRREIAENTAMTKTTHESVILIVDILNAAKLSGRFLSKLGYLAKWIASVATAAVILYSLWKGKFPPINT